MKRSNIPYIISSLTLFLMLVALCVVIFWMIYPYRPLIFKDAKLRLDNKIVQREGTLSYKVSYCKNTTSSASLTRSFVDDIVYSTSTLITNRPDGCNKMNVEVEIPHNLPLGKYYLENTYVYKVNPIREVTVKIRTEQFEIIE